jgi:hypothetical protein
MKETKPPKFKKSIQKPENSQDYGQKPHLNCTFMNLAFVHITQQKYPRIRHLEKDSTMDFLNAGIICLLFKICCRYMYSICKTKKVI